MSWWTVHCREVRYVPSVAPVARRSFTPPHLKSTTNLLDNADSDEMPDQEMEEILEEYFANVGCDGGNLRTESLIMWWGLWWILRRRNRGFDRQERDGGLVEGCL